MDERLRGLRDEAIAAGEPVPDPSDGAANLQWAAQDGPQDAKGVGRYLTRLWWERPDLQHEFPGVFLDPDARTEFIRWVHHFGAVESGVPVELIAPEPPGLTNAIGVDTPLPLETGTTCVGYFRAVLGVGAAGRRMAGLLQTGGERIHMRTYDHTSAPKTVAFDETDEGGRSAPALDLLVLCVNGSETERLSRALGPWATTGRYRIGLWGWELDTFPRQQQAGFDFVDEVWTYSEFAREAIARVAPEHVSVHTVALGADIAAPANAATAAASAELSAQIRQQYGLAPSGPLVGFAFDFASSVGRKNPAAAIEAYCRAVPRPTTNDHGPSLILKTINGASFPDEVDRLRALADGRPDVVVLDRMFDAQQHSAFVSSLSVYLSLHRSEGYGLTLLEAMAAGVPVIATAYSGNLDFMSTLNSWLIPYRLVPTVATGQYPDGLFWAQADIDAAAAALREVLTAGSEVAARTRQAQRDAQALIDPTNTARWIRARLATIREQRAQKLST